MAGMPKKIVLLFSGGLDSTVALCDFLSQGVEVFPLCVNYGQKHIKEMEAAREICRLKRLDLKVADLSSIRELIQKGSQTDPNTEVPEGHYTEDSMKLTVVPNRNMIMLSVAIGWAITLEADAVAYAAHSGDHTIYPDCRPVFINSMREASQLCDWHKVELLTPYENKTKAEIVKRGFEVSAPFSLTWSCYKGEEVHCGKCGTCVERKEAFDLAHVFDPTSYSEKISTPKKTNPEEEKNNALAN